MPTGNHISGPLVRRPRGGRKSKTPTPPPQTSLTPHTPQRLPFDRPSFQDYRETAVPSPGDESASLRSVENEYYDPQDYEDAEYYRNNVHYGADDGEDDEETDDSDVDTKDAIRYRQNRLIVDKHKKNDLNVKRESGFLDPLKVAVMVWALIGITLLYHPLSASMQSIFNTNRYLPYYRINQTAAVEGQAGDVTRSVSVLVHLPNKARNVNITEEILGGKLCIFNETHFRIREDLQSYLKLAPAPHSCLYEHQFYNRLVDFDRTFAEGTRFLATGEYMLCLYSELDIASDFVTASFPLQDIQVFANLYNSRVDEIRHDLKQSKEITEKILMRSQNLQAMAAGCGGYSSRSQPGNCLCDFVSSYQNIDARIQRQYTARLRWYVGLIELAAAANNILRSTLDVLEVESRKGVMERVAPIRGFVKPFINAMGGLISAIGAAP